MGRRPLWRTLAANVYANQDRSCKLDTFSSRMLTVSRRGPAPVDPDPGTGAGLRPLPAVALSSGRDPGPGFL